ncbi:DUF2750 domain-containing protein [Pseudoalteromonas denitrificans]|uniref:DUF2750 domain-containing protein n=1 Tax=Pseudoalteromonas denitrificans DSM 6059 TaxID=1123010 RepID=A0A1I1KN23_9GAMM|nr:DUF2750 domain-containing protein [Pseudoalteromonas denitrificans]SFC62167.1 Protein of unknown function [Pseudoalteromonas denitrificans DSM 6059]
MKDDNQILTAFLAELKPTQTLWALQDKASEDWVVLDSINFENTDVMPVWSNNELAQQHCVDEWKSYVPAEIPVADWLEFWAEDLNEDGVIIGVNWQEEGECLEVDLSAFTQGIASIEAL